jgi:hypothetical protein
MKKANLRLAIAASLGLLVVGGRTEASVLIDISQVGSNVVAVGSGELDLIGLTFDLGLHVGPGVAPNYAVVGPMPANSFDNVFALQGLSVPGPLGPGNPTCNPNGDLCLPSSGTGDTFGIGIGSGGLPALYVPFGYKPGSSLSGSSTFSGRTLASMGLTPGTYQYTWSSDSLTVKIGTVPEPSTWAMMLPGFAGGLMGWRARRRAPTAA